MIRNILKKNAFVNAKFKSAMSATSCGNQPEISNEDSKPVGIAHCAASPIIQYVVVRGDLQQTMKWPAGAVVAQACHACCAVIHLNYSHPDTQAYLTDLDRMHKVVLQVKDDTSLRKISEKLNAADIQHKMWIEQPENIPTCLAVRPYPKSDVQQYFKGLKLLK